MVGTDCLACHAGGLDTERQQYREIGITEHAIGCERCHGPGSLHVERHRQSAEWQGEDLTIVHPVALSRTLLEADCGQCHLQSAALVRIRGRSSFEFRPGLPLTDFWIDYQTGDGDEGMTVTGHIEQMRMSRCYQNSETLTCTTCHSMHNPSDNPDNYKQKCLQCHTSEQCTQDVKLRHEHSTGNNCVACHMPTSDTEIPHIAFTHHRIAVHQTQESGPRQSNPTLIPVEDISNLPSIDQDRCLGLAYLQFSESQDTQEHVQTTRLKSMQLLTSVYDRGLQDGETLAALSNLFVGQDDNVAEQLAARAIESTDISVASRAAALFVLADIYFQSDRREEAVQRLAELVELRRVYEDWFLLGSCHYLAGRSRLAIEAFEQARRINPFRPEIHQLLSRSYSQIGEHSKAAHHLAMQQALQASSPPN